MKGEGDKKKVIDSLNVAARKRRRRTSKKAKSDPVQSASGGKEREEREDTRHLCLDELVRHARDGGAAALVAQVAEEADEGVVGGAEGGDVVGLVVGVGAGEGLAARQRGVAVLGEDHLDAVDVVGVDDGRDVKVVGARVPVPAHLAEHAWDVGGPVVVRVPVADPGVGEIDAGGAVACDGDGIDGRERLLGREDDVAGRTVLVDELDGVGCCQREEGRGGSDEGA